MKGIYKLIITAGALLLFLVFLPTGLLALPDPQTDVDLPLDGGISFLLAAGIGYGIKKARDEQKKKSRSQD